MVAALEMTNNREARTRFDDEGTAGTVCRDFCFKNGLVMRAVGDTMIISPPLIISHAEIDELVTKARKCLDLTLEYFKGGKLIHASCYNPGVFINTPTVKNNRGKQQKE
ncbi:hypothetical protein ACTL6P_06950 [Endozoicomonas acroporae]|uniref:hypothetical protein n=1 Tax=Endozoicomonas acroporae TaxID=1701104 RepID=UPI0023EA636B|nr:hypothetical protein [Endozoicomonas acroporae]